MDLARNWVLKLIIHDYRLGSQNTRHLKEVVFICVLQQNNWLTVLPVPPPESSHFPRLDWTGSQRVLRPRGTVLGDLGSLGSRRPSGAIFAVARWTKASLVVASCLRRCFPSPVERKGQPVTNAKQARSSSPVQRTQNRTTQIWMETIANISQQGLWKKHLIGPLSREFN